MPMEGLGCIKEEGGTSFVSNYSIRPPIRFEIPQSWTNLLLFYFYKWPCAGGRRLSSNKVDGCWLDDDPRIFVSAIICQVLSTITSGSDIGDCTLRWYYALPGWLLTTNQIRRLSWSSSYYTPCQSPSSATHFSQFSPILSEHFRNNLSEWHHICHQAAS